MGIREVKKRKSKPPQDGDTIGSWGGRVWPANSGGGSYHDSFTLLDAAT
jgi:hypothetical protein